MPERQPETASPFSALSTGQKSVLYNRAAELFSDNKRALFDRLAPLRTRHISVVLEDIYQSHNAAAVLRSCDCFGVQDVHVVEANNPFNPAGDVAVGSSKWVDYYRYPSIGEVYRHLHAKGYRIVATLPHENDTMIGDLDISQPTALVFGTELTGLTQEAIAGADAYVKIPMYGFTESFNISGIDAALSDQLFLGNTNKSEFVRSNVSNLRKALDNNVQVIFFSGSPRIYKNSLLRINILIACHLLYIHNNRNARRQNSFAFKICFKVR